MEGIMKQERVDPGWAWTRKLNISAGVKLGDTVYTSGTVAFDSEGNVIGEGDVYAQSKQVFKNIEEVLAAAGATMADVVKITTFLTDMSGYGAFGRARSEAFPRGVPARALSDLIASGHALQDIGWSHFPSQRMIPSVSKML
jgi:enamine deaminase RidA (YjgF/YER057c/UK114 family)